MKLGEIITESEGLNRFAENRILISMDVGNESVYPTGQSGGAEYAPPAVAPEPRRRRRRAETNHWSLSNAGP